MGRYVMVYFCKSKWKFSMKQRYFLRLAYNGKAFSGWQIQPNAPSVQQTLNEALSRLLREPVYVVGAGRTDTGVHAECMYCHFETTANIDELVFKLNRYLSHEVAVYDLKPVLPKAHARFDALWRSYIYRLHFDKSPFLYGLSYCHFTRLDFDAMNRAAALMVGEHNFRAFEKSRAQENTGICNVTRAEWVKEGNEWLFHITANRFLRNMVRAVVGTLIEIGEGKRPIESIPQLLQSENRSDAGTSVPPQGLYLSDIQYPDHIFI